MPRMWDYIRGPGLILEEGDDEDPNTSGYDTVRLDPQMLHDLARHLNQPGLLLDPGAPSITTGRNHSRLFAWSPYRDAHPTDMDDMYGYYNSHRAFFKGVGDTSHDFTLVDADNYVQIHIVKVHTTAVVSTIKYNLPEGHDDQVGFGCLHIDENGQPDFDRQFGQTWFKGTATSSKSSSNISIATADRPKANSDFFVASGLFEVTGVQQGRYSFSFDNDTTVFSKDTTSFKQATGVWTFPSWTFTTQPASLFKWL